MSNTEDEFVTSLRSKIACCKPKAVVVAYKLRQDLVTCMSQYIDIFPQLVKVVSLVQDNFKQLDLIKRVSVGVMLVMHNIKECLHNNFYGEEDLVRYINTTFDTVFVTYADSKRFLEALCEFFNAVNAFVLNTNIRNMMGDVYDRKTSGMKGDQNPINVIQHVNKLLEMVLETCSNKVTKETALNDMFLRDLKDDKLKLTMKAFNSPWTDRVMLDDGITVSNFVSMINNMVGVFAKDNLADRVKALRGIKSKLSIAMIDDIERIPNYSSVYEDLKKFFTQYSDNTVMADWLRVGESMGLTDDTEDKTFEETEKLAEENGKLAEENGKLAEENGRLAEEDGAFILAFTQAVTGLSDPQYTTIANSLKKCKTINVAADILESFVQKVTEQIKALQNTVLQKTTALQDAELQKTTTERDVAVLREVMGQAPTESAKKKEVYAKTKLQEEVPRLTLVIGELNQQLKDQTTELGKQETQLNDQTTKLDAQTKQLGDTATQLEDQETELKTLKSNIDDLKRKLSAEQNRTKDLVDDNNTLLAANADYVNEHESVHRRLKEQDATMRRNQLVVDEATERIEALMNELTDIKVYLQTRLTASQTDDDVPDSFTDFEASLSQILYHYKQCVDTLDAIQEWSTRSNKHELTHTIPAQIAAAQREFVDYTNRLAAAHQKIFQLTQNKDTESKVGRLIIDVLVEQKLAKRDEIPDSYITALVDKLRLFDTQNIAEYSSVSESGEWDYGHGQFNTRPPAPADIPESFFANTQPVDQTLMGLSSATESYTMTGSVSTPPTYGHASRTLPSAYDDLPQFYVDNLGNRPIVTQELTWIQFEQTLPSKVYQAYNRMKCSNCPCVLFFLMALTKRTTYVVTYTTGYITVYPCGDNFATKTFLVVDWDRRIVYNTSYDMRHGLIKLRLRAEVLDRKPHKNTVSTMTLLSSKSTIYGTLKSLGVKPPMSWLSLCAMFTGMNTTCVIDGDKIIYTCYTETGTAIDVTMYDKDTLGLVLGHNKKAIEEEKEESTFASANGLALMYDHNHKWNVAQRSLALMTEHMSEDPYVSVSGLTTDGTGAEPTESV